MQPDARQICPFRCFQVSLPELPLASFPLPHLWCVGLSLESVLLPPPPPPGGSLQPEHHFLLLATGEIDGLPPTHPPPTPICLGPTTRLSKIFQGFRFGILFSSESERREGVTRQRRHPMGSVSAWEKGGRGTRRRFKALCVWWEEEKGFLSRNAGAQG